MWTRDELIAIARPTARAHGLDEALFCALVEQESSWSPWAIRFEPGFYARYENTLHLLPETERYARAFSWGLCQVMGQTARELGWQGSMTQLCEPLIGLEYGARKLRKCYPEELPSIPNFEEAPQAVHSLALSHYNGGGNPNYAIEVLARVKNY